MAAASLRNTVSSASSRSALTHDRINCNRARSSSDQENRESRITSSRLLSLLPVGQNAAGIGNSLGVKATR